MPCRAIQCGALAMWARGEERRSTAADSTARAAPAPPEQQGGRGRAGMAEGRQDRKQEGNLTSTMGRLAHLQPLEKCAVRATGKPTNLTDTDRSIKQSPNQPASMTAVGTGQRELPLPGK